MNFQENLGVLSYYNAMLHSKTQSFFPIFNLLFMASSVIFM